MTTATRRLVTLLLPAVLLAPLAGAHTLARAGEGTFLDFRTQLVYDSSGRLLGPGTSPLFAHVEGWAKHQPMPSTATGRVLVVDYERPGVSVDLDGEKGVCMEDYCITADAFVWHSNLLGAPVMTVTWRECTPVCVYRGSPEVHATLTNHGNHLAWADSFDAPRSWGLITDLCVHIDGVPADCSPGPIPFGVKTLEYSCLVYYQALHCASMIMFR